MEYWQEFIGDLSSHFVIKTIIENLYFTRINYPVAKQAEKNNNLINLTINRTESIYTA